MMTFTDLVYISLLRAIKSAGNVRPSRNHPVQSHFGLPVVTFNSFPLVTVRKTAWKLAIREMEWFLSGDPHCPSELSEWWGGQLNPKGCYYGGYGNQFRDFNEHFDQVAELIDSIEDHPFSRRLVLTAWNPAEMAVITNLNENEKTPTTCHTTIAQFYVCDGILSMKSYQRSADMLLGVPHNWVQSWAMLMWFAQRTGFGVGSMQWIFGDAHIYQEESHLAALDEILNANTEVPLCHPELDLKPTNSFQFSASNFDIVGDIPSPATTIRPKLL
jgi:thymidylate synthase